MLHYDSLIVMKSYFKSYCRCLMKRARMSPLSSSSNPTQGPSRSNTRTSWPTMLLLAPRPVSSQLYSSQTPTQVSRCPSTGWSTSDRLVSSSCNSMSSEAVLDEWALFLLRMNGNGTSLSIWCVSLEVKYK